MHPSVELPPIQGYSNLHSTPPIDSRKPPALLPSMLAHSPPGRSSTLPPLDRRVSTKRDKPARPRKSSITENSKKPHHERMRPKEHSKRLSIEGRKAFSAEPPGTFAASKGTRWEDLIEAATSATEADSDRDLTPVRSPLLQSVEMLLINDYRFPNRRHHLSKEPLYLHSQFPVTRTIKLRRYRMPSHLHLPISSQVSHLLLPSIPHSIPLIPSHHMAVGTIFTFLLPAFLTIPTPVLQPCTPPVNQFKFTAPDVAS